MQKRIVKGQQGLRKQSSRDFKPETGCTAIWWCGKASNSSYLPLSTYDTIHRYIHTSFSLVSSVIASYTCVVI